MMRSYRLLFVAVTLALSLGCGGTTTTTADSSTTPAAGPPKAEPRGETNINVAGDMDYARRRDFPFTIANTGGEPLTLTLLSKSCSCAEIDVPPSIAPGGEDKVVIHWTPIPGAVGREVLSIDVGTNDTAKKTLHFQVTAHIQPLVHVFVEGRENNPGGGEFTLDFTVPPVSPSRPGLREITVFSTKVASFQVNAACSVPGFEVSQPTAIPAGSRVGEYENAVGYKFEVRSTKDVPIGYSRGVVNLNLSKLGEDPLDRTLAIPLVAISSGGGFTTKPDLFEFKKPKLTDPDTASVVLTVLDPAAKEEVTVESHEPSFLKVDAPEKAGLPGRWKITVHLPENNAEAAKYQVNPPMIGHVKLKVAGLDRPVNIEVKWDPPSK